MTDAIWAPQPGPQTRLLSCPADEILFGGAAGGGKTDALIGDWLAHMARSDGFARGLLVRHSYPQLAKIIERTTELYPRLGARWHAAEKYWSFPCGATLKLRFLEKVSDAEEYQGHEYTWLGVDEVGNFKEPAPIDRLGARLRSAAGVKTRTIMTANPGGPGHHWLKERFVDKNRPGEPFKDNVTGKWRVFLPSRLQDNKKLMESDPTYADRLKGSGPSWLVRAWLDGDWDAAPGEGIFKRDWMKFYSRRPIEIRDGQNVYVVVDAANSKRKGSDYTAMWAVGLGEDQNYYVLDMVRDRLSLTERWEAVRDLHKQWKPILVGYERYGLMTDIDYFKERMEHENYRFAVTELAGSTAKYDRIAAMEPSLRAGRWWWPKEISRMAWIDNGSQPEKRRVNLIELYMQELELFPVGAHDDMLDSQARVLDPGLSAIWPQSQPSRDKDYRGEKTYSGSWLSS